MKYNWLLAFLLGMACVGPIFTQTVTVSEEVSLNSDTAYELLGELGNHILLFRMSNSEFKVQAFNQQLRESWQKELTLDKRSPQVIGVVPTAMHFSLLYTFREKGNTVIKLHRYDPGANLMDSARVISLGFLFYTPLYEIVRSEDRSKVLLYYAENQEKIHAFAIDLDKQQLMWKKKIEPSDFIYGRDFRQALIDNQGRMTLIMERNNYRSRRKEHYLEFFYCAEGEDIATRRVVMDDHLTYDAIFEADNLNGQIVGAGLYAVDNPERVEGYFYLRLQPNVLDSTGHFLAFNKFEEPFLENLLTKDYRPGKGMEQVSVQDIRLRRDGGALLVGERNRQIERRSGVPSRAYPDGMARLAVDYYYEDAFLLSIHPDGQLHWDNILHKRQYSQDDGGIFSSFFLLASAGLLRFVYNDEISNSNTVSEFVVNGLGEYDRNSLFNTSNLEVKLRVRDAVQIASNKVVIPSERRNRLKIVRLELQ